MTEEEWCVSSDPEAMLQVLRGCAVASERKLRLFAYVCAEMTISQISNGADYQRILATTERLAEGLASADEVRVASEEGLSLELNSTSRLDARLAAVVSDALQHEADSAACGTVADLLRFETESDGQSKAGVYAKLLRCVFGKPFRGLNVGFRPFRLDPEWRTSTVVQLARGIYDERAFDRLPILADALQDAGCDNPDVLNHCRHPGPHARGCWVVDLVLGKQ